MSLYKNNYNESTGVSTLDLVSNISGNYYDPLAGVIIEVPTAVNPVCTQAPYFDSTGKCLIPGTYLMVTQVPVTAGANHVGPITREAAWAYFDETQPNSRSAGCAMVHFAAEDTVLSKLYRWGTYSNGIQVQLTLIKRDAKVYSNDPVYFSKVTQVFSNTSNGTSTYTIPADGTYVCYAGAHSDGDGNGQSVSISLGGVKIAGSKIGEYGSVSNDDYCQVCLPLKAGAEIQLRANWGGSGSQSALKQVWRLE